MIALEKERFDQVMAEKTAQDQKMLIIKNDEMV